MLTAIAAVAAALATAPGGTLAFERNQDVFVGSRNLTRTPSAKEYAPAWTPELARLLGRGPDAREPRAVLDPAQWDGPRAPDVHGGRLGDAGRRRLPLLVAGREDDRLHEQPHG